MEEMLFKAREELIGSKRREVRADVMVIEGGRCEKDLRLVGREFH